MVATRPPARTMRVHRSKVSRTPTASIATCTPRPSVRSRTCCPAPSPETTVIADSPTGPAPTTATVSPGFTPPYCTPISKPVGGCRVGEEQRLLVRDVLGHRVKRGLGTSGRRHEEPVALRRRAHRR